MSRILIDVERMKHPHSGLGEFCRQLSLELLRQKSADLKLTFLRPKGLNLHLGPDIHTHDLTFWHRIFSIPSAAYDLWHATHQDSLYFPKGKRTKTLLTIHDLNFLYENRASKTKARLKKLQKKIDRVDAISTISEFTLGQVQEHLKLGSKPVKVIPNGVASLVGQGQARPEKLKSTRPFFLYLGMVRPKKNIHSLLGLLKKMPEYDLVIAGDKQHIYAQDIEGQAQKLSISSQVHFLGTVSDAQKSWLFHHCEVFLFPSLAEGFGMPIIEAMSIGKPVVAQKATSLPEVGGPDIFYFEDSDPAHQERVVRQALAQGQTHPELKESWQKRARDYSWENSVRAYLAFYRTLL